MAKSSKVDTRLKTQTILKRPKGAKPELGIDTTQTNPRADSQVKLLFVGLLSLTVILAVLGIFWTVSHLVLSVAHKPTDYIGVVAMTAGTTLILLFARNFVWMSFFAAIMFASKTKAWNSQEYLCRLAIRLRKIIPAGYSTASLILAQNLLGKSKSDDVIEIAQKQWEQVGSKAKNDQNTALLCATAALAQQLKGNTRESISWNNRAIAAFKGILEQIANPKGIMSKILASQSRHWVGTIHMHLAVVLTQNANCHFNLMNHHQAKESYKQAVENANRAPDSPEKREILRLSREQLGRLKHA